MLAQYLHDAAFDAEINVDLFNNGHPFLAGDFVDSLEAELSQRSMPLVRSKFPRSGDDERHLKADLIQRVVLQPAEELGNTIDLIIVPSVWKRQQFREELAQPCRARRQIDVSCLNLR
jgi:hypothetical protein